MNFYFKVLLSSVLIAGVSWLAGKKPALAGFLMSLPLASMIALAFAQTEWQDAQKSAELAKSIFISVPLSLTFFIPFLFMKPLKLSFWGAYAAGILLLMGSFLLHKAIFKE